MTGLPSYDGRPLPLIDGTILNNEPMSAHTSFRIGGPADLFAIPSCVQDLQALLVWAKSASMPVFILGAGSNLLVSDKGIRGMVIQFGSGFKQIRVQGREVTTGSAVRLPVLVRRALGSGLTGLQGLAGIPGTVGGAICMNAGTPTGCIADTLYSVKAIDESGNLLTIDADDLGLRYRGSDVVKKNLIIVEATFLLSREQTEGIMEILESLMRKRKASQPGARGTAGSVFKNPEGDHAGRILDSLGVKGMQSGGARVSSKHANFIVNTGAASADDVRTLIFRLQELAKEKCGVRLESEIQMVGEWE